MTGQEDNHRGHDDVASAIIRDAKPAVIELHEKYKAAADQPLPARAAQELRELSDYLRNTGKTSGNALAERDLAFEADRLDFFITSHGLVVGSGGVLLFDRA